MKKNQMLLMIKEIKRIKLKKQRVIMKKTKFKIKKKKPNKKN